MHAYTAYGLSIASELPFAELNAAQPASEPDVVVRTGALHFERHPDAAVASWVRVLAEARTTECTYDGVGRFSVREGREIVVDALPETDPGFVRHVLLGPVFAQLLWQRDLFTLHASVVRVGTRVLGFVGASGEGKSTTAAALEAHGHALLCDDIAVIPWRDSPICALPGFPRIRLYEDSLRGIGAQPDEHPRIHSLIDKHLRTPRHFLSQPQKLDAICVLSTGPELATERMDGAPALFELLRHAYNASQFAPIVGFERITKMAAQVAVQVPMLRLSRPKELARLPELVHYLECHDFS